jgi:hypothetical protein
MTIREDVRVHDHQVPDDALDWKSTAVDFRANPFHDNANSAFVR